VSDTTACIRLEDSSNIKTRERYIEATQLLIAMLETQKSESSVGGDEQICPIAVVESLESADEVVQFTISDEKYISRFTTLAKVVMEKYFIGDKYSVVINAEK